MPKNSLITSEAIQTLYEVASLSYDINSAENLTDVVSTINDTIDTVLSDASNQNRTKSKIVQKNYYHKDEEEYIKSAAHLLLLMNELCAANKTLNEQSSEMTEEEFQKIDTNLCRIMEEKRQSQGRPSVFNENPSMSNIIASEDPVISLQASAASQNDNDDVIVTDVPLASTQPSINRKRKAKKQIKRKKKNKKIVVDESGSDDEVITISKLPTFLQNSENVTNQVNVSHSTRIQSVVGRCDVCSEWVYGDSEQLGQAFELHMRQHN